MEILLDCIPCMLKQALSGSRLATDNVEIQEDIMKDSIEILSGYKSYETAPELARAIHQCIKERTGITDPYEMIKKRDLHAAKKVYKYLKEFLLSKDNQLYWALKIAATGNNIDAAINENVDVYECIKTELSREFSINDLDVFEEKLGTAKNILIIGDNTGETIFDKVLIECLPKVKFTYAVRSAPMINDVTMEDALSSELNHVSTLISSGCNAPGLLLKECSAEFLKIYNQADLIISKGQGNYEALSEEKDLFFLLKAKCSMIAGRLNVNLNEYVLKYSKGEEDE